MDAARLLAAPRARVPLSAAPYVLIALITIVLLFVFNGALTPDVSGQFWIARTMRRGARLYTDIIEINPPSWFWMAMPIDALAEAIGVRDEPVIIVTIGALVLASVAATARLLPPLDPVQRALLLGYVVLMLLVMPARHLEQREHLALIAAIPWLVLVARRQQRLPVPVWLAVAVGVAAGLGFTLKPYFLGVPVLGEVWLALSLRRDWRPFRAENIALAAIGLGYAAAILAFAPQYLTSLALLTDLYADFGVTLWQATGPIQFGWACLIIAIAWQWRSFAQVPLTTVFLLGGVGFGMSWGLQHKGWFYQAVPATACFAIALATLLIEARPPVGRVLRLFVPALLAWPLALALIDSEPPITADNDIAPAFAELGPGDSFGLVSTIGPTSWPALVGRDLRFASRFPQYWMLRAIQLRGDDPKVAAYAREVVRQTAADYRCSRPKVIVFVRYSREPGSPPMIDPYALFMREPEFAQVMQSYRLTRTGKIYDAWTPAGPLPPCSAVAAAQ